MGPVQLRIDNRTEYRTDDLRKAFAAGLRSVGISYNMLVEVIYARTSTINAMASYPEGRGITWMRFAFPRGKFSMFEFAKIFEHEAQHSQGLRHRDMIHWEEFRPTWHRGLKIRYRKRRKGER